MWARRIPHFEELAEERGRKIGNKLTYHESAMLMLARALLMNTPAPVFSLGLQEGEHTGTKLVKDRDRHASGIILYLQHEGWH